jgi:hypothetical protein
MNITLIARVLSGVVAAIMLYLGVRYMFTPDALSGITNITADNAFGASNIRAMGAPLLAIGLVTAIGAVKVSSAFLTPAPLYLLMLILSRIVTLAMDGAGDGVINALILATVFFAVTEFAVQVVKKSEKARASAS